MTSEERDDMKRHFGVLVEGLRSAFRDETARNFAAVRSEIVGSRTGVPLPRRPRPRRRSN